MDEPTALVDAFERELQTPLGAFLTADQVRVRSEPQFRKAVLTVARVLERRFGVEDHPATRVPHQVTEWMAQHPHPILWVGGGSQAIERTLAPTHPSWLRFASRLNRPPLEGPGRLKPPKGSV